jgi:hypothetical protein
VPPALIPDLEYSLLLVIPNAAAEGAGGWRLLYLPRKLGEKDGISLEFHGLMILGSEIGALDQKIIDEKLTATGYVYDLGR